MEEGKNHFELLLTDKLRASGDGEGGGGEGDERAVPTTTIVVFSLVFNQ